MFQRSTTLRALACAAVLAFAPFGAASAAADDGTTPTTAPAPTAPSVVSLSPWFGPWFGGNTVVITNAESAIPVTSVKFGAATATIVSQTSTTTTVVVPEGAKDLAVPVIESNAAGDSEPSDDSTYLYLPFVQQEQPVVTVLSPAHGPANGGTSVTVKYSATSLSDITHVSFGGKLVGFTRVASSVDLDGGYDIVGLVTAPPGTVGSTVDVVLTNAAGDSPIVAADKFTYTSAVPTPQPTPTIVIDQFPTFDATLKGSATIKNLVKGAVPLAGSIHADWNLSSFQFRGKLTLAQTTASLTALGFLPVVAKLSFVPTEDVVGTLNSSMSKLNLTTKMRIKLPSITTFGLQVAGGASCQTTQPSSIALASTQAQFDPFTGGPIAGTFAISNLAGCGVLNGLVSPLTAGSGNTILLNLTPTDG